MYRILFFVLVVFAYHPVATAEPDHCPFDDVPESIHQLERQIVRDSGDTVTALQYSSVYFPAGTLELQQLADHVREIREARGSARPLVDTPRVLSRVLTTLNAQYLVPSPQLGAWAQVPDGINHLHFARESVSRMGGMLAQTSRTTSYHLFNAQDFFDEGTLEYQEIGDFRTSLAAAQTHPSTLTEVPRVLRAVLERFETYYVRGNPALPVVDGSHSFREPYGNPCLIAPTDKVTPSSLPVPPPGGAGMPMPTPSFTVTPTPSSAAVPTASVAPSGG